MERGDIIHVCSAEDVQGAAYCSWTPGGEDCGVLLVVPPSATTATPLRTHPHYLRMVTIRCPTGGPLAAHPGEPTPPNHPHAPPRTPTQPSPAFRPPACPHRPRKDLPPQPWRNVTYPNWLVGYISGRPCQLQGSWMPADSNAIYETPGRSLHGCECITGHQCGGAPACTLPRCQHLRHHCTMPRPSASSGPNNPSHRPGWSAGRWA
jgi:hypothetical protein